ncbi:drug resistance transporter, EmrB/QacA subfamily [Geodermatophilus obscurus]|uniref:Drug resistance transporter, EmrB/QacA subfamily n=1 Tax=Geodermatophilus obscurus TaxID=1861 RepID=A0A1I5C9A4_9ACTN|nr:MFS transporter [Geodermatophilus obscurus]SFN83603.1 drug resistance transporter, EmrB/QacA subfamily [Geodermatophilus obscurus]
MPPRSATDAARSVPGPDAEHRPDPRRWRALSVTLVVGFMTLLDVSIVSVALPSLQTDLGATPATVQWVVSGYALTFGLVLVPAGRLGDAFGRRRLFLAGLAGFVLASAAAGAAPSIGWLVAARLVQGLAAGCLAPQNSALIQQLFRGAERGRAFGLFGATVGISTAVGPVAGGAILGLASGPDGWRWLFYVNVPIGVVAFVLALRLLPPGGGGRRGRVDGVGVLLLGAGALAVLFPLVQAEAGGLSRLWWLFGVGAALLAAFVAWERRVVARDGDPVFDPRLVTRTRGYGIGAALGTVYFVGFSGIWLVFALFFQTGLGYTPLQSGLAVTPFALGSATAAVVAGRLVERYGRRLTVLGLAGVMVGLTAAAVVLLLVPPSAAGWAIAPALLLGGIGGGFVISPNITMTLRDVPVAMAGSAGGGLQTAQRFGAAVGTAALPGLFYLVLSATDDYPAAAAAGLAVSVLGAGAALVLGLVDLGRSRAEEAAEQEAAEHEAAEHEAADDDAHGHAHAWHH